MKKNNITILFLLVLIVFVGCNKDKELGSRQPKVTNEEVTTTSNSATISWMVDFPGDFHSGIEICENENMNDAKLIEVVAQNGLYSIKIDSLILFTKYYYRQKVWNSYSQFVLDTKSFTTKNVCYTIKVVANPDDCGIVSGGGIYEIGQTCMVRAVAKNDCVFVNWTENGTIVSDDTIYTFTVNSSSTFIANFTRPYVDLSLPSGILWATYDVGADCPEEHGSRFAWGEIQSKDIYDWGSYRFCNGVYNKLTKYCCVSNYGNGGFTDDLTVLLPQDDAATANWGADWRIPTKEEWMELYQNTTHAWTTQNNVTGIQFVASNGATLFLPSRYYYWSSSLDQNRPYYAWTFWFSSSSYGVDYQHRYCGLPIRAVRSRL